MLDRIRRELTLALRAIRKNPGFSAVVVATLGTGIAASTVVFSVMNPYLLRALPFGEAERLVQLGLVDPVSGWDAARFSLPQLEDWKQRTRALEEVGAYYYRSRNVTGDFAPEQVTVGVVTGNLFGVLRSPAAQGRTIGEEDAGPGGRAVVVVSHAYWTGRLGGTSNVLGRAIRLDGEPHTVVGVMPPDFNFPWNEVRLWTPLRSDAAAAARDQSDLIPVGRLRAGVTRTAALAELEGIHRELAALHPDADGRLNGVTVKPLRQALNFAYDIVRIGLTVLLAAVCAVLLIACVNVAGLMLARAAGRRREMAIRLALGAARSRLATQLFTESLTLALLGGALGVGLSALAIRALGPVLPEALFRVGTASLDGRVLLFSTLLTLAAPLLFGLTPVLAGTRADLTTVLKQGSRGATTGDGLRTRRILVMAQVALAVVLVTSAGLMVRSFLAVQRADPGFQAGPLLTVRVLPPEHAYAGRDEVTAYFDRATDALRGVPGARGAATVYPLPLNHENFPVQFATPERAGSPGEEWPAGLWTRAAPGYFDAMRIPLVGGRDFAESDGPGAAPVVIVSRLLAAQHWPGEDAVGRTLLIASDPQPLRVTVIGVAGDIRHDGLTGPMQPHIYRPLAQSFARGRFIVIPAAAGDPVALAAEVRTRLAQIDANLPITIRPMRDVVRENDFQWSISSIALTAFGGLAILLAALGLYGLIAYSVAQRRRELGIRLALGATGRQVRRLVVLEATRLAGWGLLAGLIAAFGAARLLASQLYGVGAFDPVTLAVVLVLFAAVAVAASARPATRAARVAPQEVLRD